MDLEETIADGCYLSIFYWFGQNCITVIIIHDHDIKISSDLTVWESASDITEYLSIDVERYDCCAQLLCLPCFCVWIKVDVIFNFHF